MRRVHEKSQRGSFLLLFGLLIIGFLGFGALSIDLSYLRNARMELRNAVDAASHAAMLEYRRSGDEASARAVARQVAAMNLVAGRHLILQDEDITFGTWNFDTYEFGTGAGFVNATHVSATRDDHSRDGPIAFFLAPVLGIDSGTAAAEAVAAFRFREVVLVLDITGSFFRDIDNGRDAIIGFLDRVYTNRLPQDKIGLVTFAQQGYVFSPLQNVDTNYMSLRTAWYGDGDRIVSCRGRNCTYYDRTWGLQICFKDKNDDGISEEPAPFNQRYIDLAGTENLNCYDGSVFSPPNREEGTAHAVGLKAAIDQIEDRGLVGNVKVIVLVSDGRSQCRQPDTPATMACVEQRKLDAQAQAQRAGEAGMSIFTVMYCSNCDAAGRASYEAYQASMTVGDGRAYFTGDSSELDDILAEIAATLPVAIVK